MPVETPIERLRPALLPRSVLGITALALAFAVGAAFSGARALMASGPASGPAMGAGAGRSPTTTLVVGVEVAEGAYLAPLTPAGAAEASLRCASSTIRSSG